MKLFVTVLILFGLFTKGRSQDVDTLVDVGTYKLHFNIHQGKGVPILFESGGGNDGSIWDTLPKPLHDSLGATLIIYDREGFGKSGIDTANININTQINGLETALRKLGFVNKYFMVAHSFRSDYGMTFINQNPKKVVGGVFVDIASPCFVTEAKARQIKNMFTDSLEAIKKESIDLYYDLKNYEQSSAVMRNVSQRLTLPLTIICSDHPPFPGPDSATWKQCIKQFSAGYKNRTFLIAKDCGHYVFLDNRNLVIDKIIKRYRD